MLFVLFSNQKRATVGQLRQLPASRQRILHLVYSVLQRKYEWKKENDEEYDFGSGL